MVRLSYVPELFFSVRNLNSQLVSCNIISYYISIRFIAIDLIVDLGP